MAWALQPKPDMPTNEYTCTNCGHSLEAYQSMKDEPLIACPACGHPTLKRLAGRGMGALFRGNGFYQTGDPKPAAGGGNPARNPRPGSEAPGS
jgi:putative FmdB family regulatory protein